MLFHTLDYLVFLPLVVLFYWGLPKQARPAILALSSLFFYGSWSLAYLPVMVLVILLAWGGGLWLARWHRFTGELWRRTAVLLLLLLPLFFFKYWDWLAGGAETLVALLSPASAPLHLPRVSLPLPVGISFFTFQSLAYVIDVGRLARKGDADAAETSLVRFTAFQTFFPQLVAGPIVRRSELLPQLRALPMLQGNQVGAGVYRICRGMAKKLLVADVVRVSIVDPVFSDPDRFTGPELLIALYAYTLQIYCDFSGYTDMAIGSARLFGIELPENFKAPYRATSVAEFWRRWHLTLSNWVRDYIYYPLGGARADKDWKVYRNLMLTMLIIGVWHGASINFVVYGTLHGLAQCINRFQRKRTGRKPGDPLPGAWAWAWRWALTFHFVVLARILFRAKDLAAAQEVLTGLLDPTFLMPRFSPLAFAVLGLGYASHFLPESWSTRAEAAFRRQHPLVWVVAAALVAVAVKRLSTGDDLAFVYYQF